MAHEKRASHTEIFAHLQALLGDEAVRVSQEVARLAMASDPEAALTQLTGQPTRHHTAGSKQLQP